MVHKVIVVCLRVLLQEEKLVGNVSFEPVGYGKHFREQNSDILEVFHDHLGGSRQVIVDTRLKRSSLIMSVVVCSLALICWCT